MALTNLGLDSKKLPPWELALYLSDPAEYTKDAKLKATISKALADIERTLAKIQESESLPDAKGRHHIEAQLTVWALSQEEAAMEALRHCSAAVKIRDGEALDTKTERLYRAISELVNRGILMADASNAMERKLLWDHKRLREIVDFTLRTSGRKRLEELHENYIHLCKSFRPSRPMTWIQNTAVVIVPALHLSELIGLLPKHLEGAKAGHQTPLNDLKEALHRMTEPLLDAQQKDLSAKDLLILQIDLLAHAEQVFKLSSDPRISRYFSM